MTADSAEGGDFADEAGRAAAFSATRNIVLRELPPHDLEMLAAAAEWVNLAAKDPVWGQNEPIEHVHFPETAVISLVTLLDAGSIEAITIGNDGFVGLPIFHGPGSTVTRAGCQMPGRSWRLSSSAFMKVCGDSPALRRALIRRREKLLSTQ